MGVGARQRDDVVYGTARCFCFSRGSGAAWRIVSLLGPNMLAGSLVDVEPNTSYDLRLRLTDPEAPARTAPISSIRFSRV